MKEYGSYSGLLLRSLEISRTALPALDLHLLWIKLGYNLMMTFIITKLFPFIFLLVVFEPSFAKVDLMGLRFQVLSGDFSRCGETSFDSGLSHLRYSSQGDFSLRDLKAQGHYCLAAEFSMPETPKQNQIMFLSVLAAGELFLDGVKVGRNGSPAQSKSEEIPGYIDYSMSLTPEQLQQGRHRLTLKLSTYHGSTDILNLFYRLSIVDQQSLLHTSSYAIFWPLLLTGALLLMSLLMIGLILCYQRQPHWLLFLFLCLVASGLLLAEAWRDFVGYLYPFHLTRLRIVEGLTYLFSILLPLYFLIYYRFKPILWMGIGLMLVTAFTHFLSPYFDLKSTLMFGVALLASFVINLISYRAQKSGSKMGLSVAIISIGLFLIPSLRFAEAGFALIVCFLLFTILFQLVQRFTHDKAKAALATQLENQLLRRSIQPHFLMNSLSLVGELLHQSPQRAEEFIQALGREFRMLNEYADCASIALVQELELCQNYLEIMSTRLQKNCYLVLEGNPSGIAIPPGILLTILENAFSHNKYRQETRFHLAIVVDARSARLTLQIPVVSQRSHAGTGTGNQYIVQSLQEVFEGRASYVTEQRDHFWYACLELPT